MTQGKPVVRVLLLEQDTKDAAKIEKELASLDLSIRFSRVENGPDFIREIEKQAPDLVLSDYILPHYTGLAGLAELGKRCPDCPFIFVSWQIHEDSVLEALKAGATDYVFKEQLSRLTLSVVRALREAGERKQLAGAHREIRRSEEYFRSLIENASDIIMVLDFSGVVHYASPSVTKVLGYTSQEFVGRNLLDFIHAEDAENAAFVFSESQEKKDLSLEFRFHHKDGSWRGLEAIGKTVTNDAGQTRIIVNSRDITDRVLEQEALRESILRHLKTQTELQKTQQKIIQQERLAAIGQMASGIAHDFSNALMPVLGFSEILLNHPEYLNDLERVRKYMEMINTSARDAMQIVGGLREFYRTKEKAENLLPLQLNKIVEQAVLMTQPKWKQESNAKGVRMQVRMDLQSLPEIVGNDTALREALTNLIFNALDAMPEGGSITFKTRSEKDHVLLEVSDTGVGMSEEVRSRCLEPFFSTKGKGGTGLGLSMVYGVVTRHEGSIDIRSQEGKGTTFIIRLPIKTLLPESNGAKPKVADKISKKLVVLVVDDEPLVRTVLQEYLLGDGHEVETAPDGAKAWKAFQKRKFDLVITDRAMPEMSGDQLTDKIKELSPKTPLIMLTGFGELMKAKGEHPRGVDYLLSKPLTFESYREAVYKAVS